MSLTPEGEVLPASTRGASSARSTTWTQLLGASRRRRRKGLLRVNATLGFGRSHVAPLISRFVRSCIREVEVQLQLSVEPAAADRRRASTSASASASRPTRA